MASVISSGVVRIGVLVMAGSLLGGLGLGCLRLSPYACGADADCDRGGVAGRCLADGACAYPDVEDRCEGDWVRSPNAAVDPGACVPDDSSDSGGTSAGTNSTNGDGTADTASSGEIPSCGGSAQVEIDTAFLSTSEILEGYPLLLSIDSAAIVDAIAASEGELAVLGPNAQLLPSEIELLDPDADALVLWVKLPSYALGEPLPLLLRWGSTVTAGDPLEVWAGTYVGVWHLSDSLSGVDGDELRNSVNPSEPGRTAGQMQPEQSVPAVVGRGLRFDGDDDVATIDAAFVGQLDAYSVSFWVRFEGADDQPGDYFQRLNGDYFYPRCWRQPSANVFCQYIVDGVVTALGSGRTQATGQLLHLAMVRDDDAGMHWLYIDGELVNENTESPFATLPTDGYPFELGHGELGTLPGWLDEVRVADRSLPPSWIWADVRTQQQPDAALLSVGAPQPLPCPD